MEEEFIVSRRHLDLSLCVLSGAVCLIRAARSIPKRLNPPRALILVAALPT